MQALAAGRCRPYTDRGGIARPFLALTGPVDVEAMLRLSFVLALGMGLSHDSPAALAISSPGSGLCM